MASDSNLLVGVTLAVVSTFFIGASFIVKKIGLLRLSQKGGTRAGSGGFGYLRDWVWWLGLVTMGLGELFNFTAYAFAPASLITPLGALSVLISAVMASKFLNEHLNLLGKLACILCLLGSTIIVIHSSEEVSAETIAEFMTKLNESNFTLYLSFILVLSLAIWLHVGPKYGHRNVVIFIFLCSAVGSLTVIFSKGLALALKEYIEGQSDDVDCTLTLSFLVGMLLCIAVQMVYLNKSLDLFNTSIVTPVYYVFFTSFVIISSNVMLNEWRNMTFENILGNFCGFSVTVIAVFMLNAFRDVDLGLSDVRSMWRPKHDSGRHDKYDYQNA